MDGEHRLDVRFIGSGSEYFRIWIVNLLLTLVTLGLYYPFAKVRRLRYFHGATEIGGHALSFHANPWAMLRGYLLVTLLFVAYGAAGRFSPTAGFVAFAVMAALWPALWHASLRFRLANTGWRGLRAAFTGSRGGAYLALLPAVVPALAFALIGLFAGEGAKPGQPWISLIALTPLLVVLALPAGFWTIKRYQHRHYALAGEQSRFDVGYSRFYGVALRTLGLSMLASLLGGVLAAVVFGLAGGGVRSWGWVPVLLGYFVLQTVVGAYVVSRLQNLLWNGTRSQHLRFDSRLRYRQLALLTARNWLLIVVTLGLYLPFAAIAMARLRLEAVTLVSDVDPAAVLAGAPVGAGDAAGDAAADLMGIDIGL